jgi:hypothetical protein
MRGFGTLILAFFLSGFVAGVLQLQLGIWFKADLELALAIVALFLFTAATSVVLGITLANAKSPTAIDRAVIVLLVIMLLVVVGLGVVTAIDARTMEQFKRSLPALLYIGAPAAVMLFIQWWLVRRRAARAATIAT